MIKLPETGFPFEKQASLGLWLFATLTKVQGGNEGGQSRCLEAWRLHQVKGMLGV